MKSVKVAIFNALNNNATLKAIKEADDKGVFFTTKVYSFYPPSNATYPCVGFYRLSGNSGSADGLLSPNKTEVYSVDCFAMSMTIAEDMEIAIDEAMNTLPYMITTEHVSDIYEETTKIFHKPLRYRIKSY